MSTHRKTIDLIKEGEQIAADARGGKNVKGFRERCSAWSRQVEDSLRDDPIALARFRHAPPVPDAQARAIVSGLAGHWQKLTGQLALLIEIARERGEPEAVTLKPGAYGISVDLKLVWRELRRWLRNHLRSDSSGFSP